MIVEPDGFIIASNKAFKVMAEISAHDEYLEDSPRITGAGQAECALTIWVPTAAGRCQLKGVHLEGSGLPMAARCELPDGPFSQAVRLVFPPVLVET